MKFIKIVSFVLVVAMMAACIVACGGNNDETTTSSTTTTTTKPTTSTTTTSSTTPTVVTPPEPDPGVEIYANDFSSSIDSDTPINNAAASLSNGKLVFANWGEAWTKNVKLDNATGEIVISFTINPNLQKDYTILAINDVAVLKSTASGIKIAGNTLSASIGYNQDGIVRIVTVKIDPATGNCTVEYAHPAGSQYGEVHTETVNVGEIGKTLKIALGSGRANGFSIDNIKVVQTEDPDTKYDHSGDVDLDLDPALSGKTITNTIGDKNLAKGESFTETLDLRMIDKTKPVKITFNVTQATDANGGEGDNAVLSINGRRTMRVTGGSAMHIWNESTGQGEGVQWNNKNTAQDVTVTFDLEKNTINFVYNNREVTLTYIDLTGDALTIKFGGTNTPALVLKNIVIEYVHI